MRREGRETDTKLNDVTGAKADLDIEVGADEDTGSGRKQDNEDFQRHFSVTKHFRAWDDDSNVLPQSRSEVVELLAEATRKFSQKIIMPRDMDVDIAKGTPRERSREGSTTRAVSHRLCRGREGTTVMVVPRRPGSTAKDP